MTENNNRQIALDFATKNAGAGARPEQITRAAEAYLTFLNGGSTPASAPAAPAPAPRTGQEIIDLIESKRRVYGSVVTDSLKTRAAVLRTVPLIDAIRQAVNALDTAGAQYGLQTTRDLSVEIRRLRFATPEAAPAAPRQGGERVVALLQGYEGTYGQPVRDLIAEAARRGFAQLSLSEAKRLATLVLREVYSSRYPTEAARLIGEIQGL